DQTGNQTIKLGSGAQTVVESSGDTIVGGNAGKAQQVIDATGSDSRTIAGPETVIGGAGPLLVEAGDHDSVSGGSGPLVVHAGSFDTIVGGSGPTTVRGSAPLPKHEPEDDDAQGDASEGDEHGHSRHGRGGGNDKHDDDDDHKGVGNTTVAS